MTARAADLMRKMLDPALPACATPAAPIGTEGSNGKWLLLFRGCLSPARALRPTGGHSDGRRAPTCCAVNAATLCRSPWDRGWRFRVRRAVREKCARVRPGEIMMSAASLALRSAR